MFMNENKRKCTFNECTGFMVMSNFVLEIFLKLIIEKYATWKLKCNGPENMIYFIPVFFLTLI